MEGLAKNLFDQAHLANEAQRISLLLGRQQMAREVMAWVSKVGAHRFGDVPVGELISLCNKEAGGR